VEDIHPLSPNCTDIADAQVIELNPSSYLGYELKYAILHAIEHYDEAFEAINIMLSKSDATHARVQGKPRTTRPLR
jgi:hypothetical protein